jgi:outer membrane beta-barrel protein
MTFALLAATAFAQDPVDIGTIRDEDITVVQKLLYPKTGRTEVGLAVGVMPFDAYITTPNAQLNYSQHFSEKMAFSLAIGAGWGFKTQTYKTLESPAYGVAPYAYRYLGSALGGVEWSPVYAKLNWNGARISHFDVYLTGRGGVSLESSVIPGGGLAIAPTLSPGIGARIFTKKNAAIRIELRDDLLLEYRKLAQSFAFKQNANVMVGYSVLSKKKKS